MAWRTIASLGCTGWLAGAAAAQAPGNVPAPSALTPINDPPPLSSLLKKPSAVPATLTPLLPPVNPASAPMTLFYQKDAAPKAPVQSSVSPTPPVTAPVAPPSAPAAPAPVPATVVHAAPVVEATPRAMIQQVAAVQPMGDLPTVPLPPAVAAAIQRKGLPSPEVLFSIKSEKDTLGSYVKEVEKNATFSVLPGDLTLEKGGYAPLSKEPYSPRSFQPVTRLVEPGYITHQRLYFEEMNAERYGWEFGPLQPFVSVGNFFYDLSALPYKFMSRPCQRYDTNYGKCLPGDPVPYLIYPIELSATGALTQAGVTVALFALIP